MNPYPMITMYAIELWQTGLEMVWRNAYNNLGQLPEIASGYDVILQVTNSTTFDMIVAHEYLNRRRTHRNPI